MINLELEVQRAERAKQILNDDLVKEALTTIETALVQAWANCPERDREGREYIWHDYRAAVRFKRYFETIVDTGKMAAIELEKQSVLEKVKRKVRL